jgi:hypothetical protein
VARTRQRRRKKHRGTQAGTVRRAGRTGSTTSRSTSGPTARRQSRLDRPPSWRAAINRAALSASVFFAVLILLLKQPTGTSLGLAAFMLVFYIPLGYATDGFLFRLRQKRKQRQAAD